MSRAQTTLHILLAALFLTSLMPVGQAASDPATDAQDNAIGAQVTVPASTLLPWQLRNELERLHLKADGITLSPLGHSTATGTTDTAQTVNLLGPTPVVGAAPAVNFAASPTFTYAVTAAGQEVSSISASLWIDARTAANVRVTLTKTPPTPAGATPEQIGQVVIPISGALVNVPVINPGPTLHTASLLLNPAKPVEAGYTIKATIDAVTTTASGAPTGALPGPTNQVILHYGSDTRDSTVTIVSDAARIKAWTEKGNGPAGTITSNFVAPDNANAEERTMNLRIAQVHADGEVGLTHFPAGFKVVKVAPNCTAIDDLDCIVHFDSSGSPAGVNAPANQRWGAPAAPPSDVVSEPGVRLTTHRLTYPDTLVAGSYLVRVTPFGFCPARVTPCPDWSVDLTVNVGGSEGTFILDETNHEKTILLGQRTSFRVQLTNNAPIQDSFALQAQPGTVPPGWTASVSPAQVTLAPGASSEAEVSVIPATNGANGQSNTIAVTATSLSSGEALPLDKTLRVFLTNQRSTGVEIVNLTAPTNEAAFPLTVSPGGSRSIPVIIQNLGNGFDRAVVSLSGAPAGWTASASPGLVELQAKSEAATILKIEAPSGASPNDPPVTIRMRAARLDNLSQADVQDFAVSISIRDQFAFQVLDGANPLNPMRASSTPATPVVHNLRDEGPDGSTTGSIWDQNPGADRDYDQSAMFRLVLRNDGDRADVYTLTPYTLTAGDETARLLAGDTPGSFTVRNGFGYQDLDGCDGDAADNLLDGKNDGWLFRMYEPGAAADFPTSPESFTKVRDDRDIQVSVPKGETRVVYVEMKWKVPTPAADDCAAAGNRIQTPNADAGSRVADPATGHAVLVEAVSGMDASKRASHVLNAKVVPPGGRVTTENYAGQVNAVYILPDADAVSKQVTTTAGQRTASYAVRVTNAGNEMDTVRVTIPQYACPSTTASTSQCWEHGFQGIDKRAVFSNDDGKALGGTCTTPSVANPNAATTARIVAFECTMGAFDEVALRVFSTAPSSARVGAHDNVRVTVTSKDSFADDTPKFDDLVLGTTVVGEYALNLVSAATAEVPVHPGQTTAIPVTIKNLGTNKDNYTVDLSNTLPAGWRADFSQPNPVFVPAGRQVDLLLFATAPTGAANNTVQKLEVRATSLDSLAVAAPTDNQTVKVVVKSKPTQLNLTGNPQDVIGAPGTAVVVKAVAFKHTASPATQVDFTLDPGSLPDGWTVSGPSAINDRPLVAAGTEASFTVNVPANALGTSRAAIRITADDDNGGNRLNAFTHLGISIDAPNLGLNLSALDGEQVYVAPGEATKVRLGVQNLGVGQDVVRLTTETLPNGWSAVFGAQNITLQPLEDRIVEATVTAPATLTAGQSRLLTFVATTQDGVRSDSVQINFTTGQSILGVVPKVATTPLRQVPLEPFTFTVTVNNTGDLPDDITMRSGLASAFKDVVKLEFTPATFPLAPGEGADVSVKVTLPAGMAPNLDVPVLIEAASNGPFLKSVGSATVPVKVLDHKVRDVDGDLTEEYAVDRDLDPSNGFEQFLDPSVGSGLSKAIDAASLLTEKARSSFAVTTIVDGNTTTSVRFLFDPDADRKTDLLVDRDADGKADVYWDPDRGYSHVIPVLKDVTKDGVEDYFFDLDGEAGLRLDVYYDAKEGRTGRLLQIDIDNNGVLDYVVDTNGNAQPDLTETVLFGGPEGSIASIREMANVDGKGGLDTVIDSDGDGKPDYFIPNGKTTGIPIVLEDVDGDGDDEWTYDSDGDGRRDAYYDPQTQKSGFLDTKGDFLSELKEHWYIGALFGVVLVLFVVLLVVTRR